MRSSSTLHTSTWGALRDWRVDGLLPAAFAAYGLVYLIVVFGAGLPENTRSLVANLGYLPIGGAAALLAWRIAATGSLPRRQRAAWALLTLSCAATFCGDALWTYVENIRGGDPSASVLANAGYLVYYPLLVAGLLLFPSAIRSREDGIKFFLDTGIVVTGCGMAVWHLVVVPLVARHQTSGLAEALALAYPLGDMIVIAGAASVLSRCPIGERRRPLLLIVGASVAAVAADLTWARLSLTGSTAAGHVQGVGYMLQYVLFAMGVADERRRVLRTPVTNGDEMAAPVTSLPYLAVVAGYVLTVIVAWDSLTIELFPLVVGSMALTGLVLGRQMVAVSGENLRLRRERTQLSGERHFKSLIQHASDMVSILDADWTVRFASPSAAQTLGYSMPSLVGRSARELIHPEDLADATRHWRQVVSDPRHVMTARWRMRRSDDCWIQTENIARNLIADENVRGLVLTTRDVSERVSLEAQLTHQAYHDPLTGLGNRSLFQHRLQDALSRPRDQGEVLGVIFLDLDGFKALNDQHGHAFGDVLLRAAAQRLSASLRPVDTSARFGGDEFAVLVEDRQRQVDVPSVAERIAHAFHAPFVVDGREAALSASIGVVLATPGQTAEDLLRNADLAMYLAKSRGGGQSAIFEPALRAALLSRLELQADLHHAVARGEITLYYQPVHSLDSQALVGAEALLRWAHPVRGSIPPEIFIPIAEETGAILPIGRWALQRACADAQRWGLADPSADPFRISVNLSARQVADPALAECVQEALHLSGLSPAKLILELTESTLLQHTDDVLTAMHRLKALGVLLAIDDFGTGYSSLSYLQRLPIDILKVDRTFVGRIEFDHSGEALARAIVALAQTMSLRTVAEGIESARQAEHLRDLGCHYGQGFFYGHPMPAADFEAYVERWKMITAA